MAEEMKRAKGAEPEQSKIVNGAGEPERVGNAPEEVTRLRIVNRSEEVKQPRVINKSGTLRMSDEVAESRAAKGGAGQAGARGGRRRDGARADVVQKEFDEVTIAIDRVARVVKGGRRFRFRALVAVGNRKDRVGVGIAKGADVTSAVTKATGRAKKSMIKINLNGDTICHEVEAKVTGAIVLMKPAAPGTGVIAGGVVKSVIGLTGIKNLISKSLGSTNKVNIAYAVIEGLRAQVPRKEWVRPVEKKEGKNEV
jgi:small subunit ribosomal protein S5